jgi:hypothetical protein
MNKMFYSITFGIFLPLLCVADTLVKGTGGTTLIKATGTALVNPPPPPVVGPSYLIAQNFEGTGYDNGETWVESGPGTINEDYTTPPAPLVGSHSLRMSAAAQAMRTTGPVFAPQTEVWGYVLLNLDALPSATRDIFNLTDASDSVLVKISITSTGQMNVRTGATSTASVGTMSAGTTYRIWCRYKAGTGANSEGEGAFGDTSVTTKPVSGNNRVLVNTGNATASADRPRVGAASGSVTWAGILDAVYVDNVDISGVP